ncbi:MAG: hypothetical protein WDZ30_06520 [Cellvibrionaceae bacterium]
MAKQSTQSLEVAQAKQRLRKAAGRMRAGSYLSGYVQQRPFCALALSFLGGVLLADERIGKALLPSTRRIVLHLLSQVARGYDNGRGS